MTVRAASERDLAAMDAVSALNEVGEAESIPTMSPQAVPAVLRHVFETGTMFVAEQDGEVLAFAGAITRGPVTYLTDLFDHPQTQSGGLGKTVSQQSGDKAPLSARHLLVSSCPGQHVPCSAVQSALLTDERQCWYLIYQDKRISL